jgi:formate dehydrogenase subunit gamma
VSTSRVLPNGQILRYTFAERLMHWIAGLTYVYVLLTGLAFHSPHLYWIAAVLGGGSASRAWHPWAGVIYTLAIVWMYREWRADMKITALDRSWNQAIGH